MATQLGVGDLADRALPMGECVRTLQRALDAGLNVVDTAPSYEDGLSEQIVGEAVRGRRSDLFLIDKIDALDQPVAGQVDASLARLGLPWVDLFVFHGVATLAQWQALCLPGGPFDQLAACIAAGKARYRGISCHNPEALVAAIGSGLCDVVMFPVGPYVDPRYIEIALPLARARGVGTVCFKTFGAGKLLGDTSGYGQPLTERPRGKLGSGGRMSEPPPELPRLTVDECVRFTLTCDPDVALLGLSHPLEQDAAFSAAERAQPLDAPEMLDLRRRAAIAMEGKGACWWNR